jgi:type VI protein secretion system component VasF
VFWDDLIRRWRREHRAVDPRELRAAGGHVAVLPGPRRRRRSRLPWLVVAALAIAGAIAILLLNGSPARAFIP